MKRIALVLLFGLLVGACSRPAPSLSPDPVSVPRVESPAPAPPAPETKAYQPTKEHQEALGFIAAEDYVAAEAKLKQVVAAEPKAAEAWNDLSMVQFKLGRFRDAADAAERALTVKPGFVFAEYNLGVALLQIGDRWQEAKPFLEASASAQPDRPEPWYALGTGYKYAGDLAQAKAAYQKAGSKYGPASSALRTLDAQKYNWADVQQSLGRLPAAPVQLIWELHNGYIPQGYTRTVDQVMPIRLSEKGETQWAALVQDRSSSDTRSSVLFQALNPTDDYLGTCKVPGAGPVTLQVVDQPGGQHLAVSAGGKTTVCARKGTRVEAVFTATGTATVTSEGLLVNGIAHQFFPELATYVPKSNASLVDMALSAIRKAGYQVEADSSAWSMLPLGSRTGVVIAWREGVALTDGGATTNLYLFKDNSKYRITYPFPHRVGTISVPGHTFIAIQTLMPGGPNGADVLVLETGPSYTLRPVFSTRGDGAGFDDTAVYASTKHYLPQGGFETYQTTYTWDEKQYTFVPGATTKVGP